MSDQPVSENVDILLPPRPRAHFGRHCSRTTRRMISYSWTNTLLVFVPIGIVAGFLVWPVEVIFALNLLAVIPLASMMTSSIDALSATVGNRLGGFMKVTLGNSVEMIIGIIALRRGHIQIIQSSLLGSVLSCSLLVLGYSFFVAGCGQKKLIFEKTLTNTMSSLMMAVSTSLIVPTIMSITSPTPESSAFCTDSAILILSHGTAAILFLIFVMYLYFKFHSHSWFMNAQQDNSATHQTLQNAAADESTSASRATGILILTALSVIICASHLVDSVDGLAKARGISKTFISLVLIPAPSYVSKCISITTTARRCQMESIIKSIIGNILQITLFIIPLLVLLGWLFKQPFTLDFEFLVAITFFLSLIVMTCTIQDGTANYFDGIMLIGTYILTAVVFYVRPSSLDNFIVPRCMEGTLLE